LRQLTGSKVAVNHHEKEVVEKALKPQPPALNAWGWAFMGVLSRMFASTTHLKKTPVDLTLEDSETSLRPFGISGKVLHTPGHSSGSVSVLLETGDAFVGDLAMNGLPWRIGPGMPCLGDDAAIVKKSWELLLIKGARRIYPAHGKPFNADLLRKMI
jgi:glyoxylase-like metal-dependent hydrolase (beta-lactamase superfamily II)